MAVRGTEKIWLAMMGFLLIIVTGTVHAACEVQVGKFVSITGSVDVQSTGGGTWNKAKLDTRLCEGDTIRVGERSRAAVSLINDAVLRIDQNTAMRLIDITPQEEESSLLDLFTGAFQSFSRKPKYLKVNTPYLNGSVEGTEFAVRIKDGATSITVLEGVVLAANDQGQVSVGAGEQAQAAKGQAPQRRTVVRPQEQVQWALYYPPVLSAQTIAARSPKLAEAANCASNGNLSCTFAALDRIPAGQRGADNLLLKASSLLAVGRVDQAGAEIDAVLQADPNASGALALRAVIDVAQNRNEAALTNAQRAIDADPNSSSAAIALSYALQANLDIPGARDVLSRAVESNPEDALVWARLSETHLMQGDRDASRAAAERAVGLEPGLGRTQTVLGFAALAEIDTAAAQAAFGQAIALGSADPLPHLGLGLAKIRQGMLDEGRADLEAAVALDSNNSLLRSYLGKAYFEEKRGPLDLTQFEVAKQLDPNDPTPWLYESGSLQSINRPVGALRSIEGSIERNDNRAVYRGGLLLDKDRASRQSGLARVYNTLGFDRMGINEARRSLAVDPANPGSHRFLSDSYKNTRRREIARVSELTQAQLLQDLVTNPVQPSANETNLNTMTGGGPTAVGVNEFTRLFERNGVSVLANGFAGSNDTAGGEAVVSGLYDQFSLSAGIYHYETDGWRTNNGLDQDIYSIFGQVAISPELNIQVEYRNRDSTEGDLAFNFDPDDFVEDQTIDRERESVRLGLKFAPRVDSTVLISYIHSDKEDKKSAQEDLDPVTTRSEDSLTDSDGDQYEAQYIYQAEAFNVVAGIGYGESDTTVDVSLEINNIFLPFPLLSVNDRLKTDVENTRAYVYTTFDITPELSATLGVAYDDYEEGPLEDDGFSPKVGLMWQPNDALRVRAAAFEAVRPLLLDNRTIEPTQVAGFNQFFDDIAASETTRYGVGFDWNATRDLIVGGELTWRELDEPIIQVVANDAFFEEREEELHRLFINWTPTPQWAVTASLVYDQYESEKGIATAFDNLPEEVETISVPVGVRYFAPSGLFAGVSGTFVDQEVERDPLASQASGDDSFFLVDLAVGYRFPNRAGGISLEVRNVFDEEFNYQDDSYREFRDEPSTGPYYPEMTLYGQVILNY